MIKYVSEIAAAKSFLKKKSDSNDSGTESDGDILDVEKYQHGNLDLDMETSLSSYADAVSPTDTVGSSESSAMMCQSHLLYDQHSSEEELEVINGPSSVIAANPALSSVFKVRGTATSLVSERGSSSLEPDELFGGEKITSKRSSSLVEKRKRSLAHSSDDELRNHLEPILTPVNFRTTPPLQAFKPNRSHMFRSTTPLILSEARCGFENMQICDNSVNNDENSGHMAITAKLSVADSKMHDNHQNNGSIVNTSLKISNSTHIIYQPLPKYSLHYNSSRSSPASTTGLDVEVRSVSPPAKLFHCAISPKRRPATSKLQQQQQSTSQQRLQRPHRPCLDFDKMQQVSLH